jgi:hypothetical protein
MPGLLLLLWLVWGGCGWRTSKVPAARLSTWEFVLTGCGAAIHQKGAQGGRAFAKTLISCMQQGQSTGTASSNTAAWYMYLWDISWFI